MAAYVDEETARLCRKKLYRYCIDVTKDLKMHWYKNRELSKEIAEKRNRIKDLELKIANQAKVLSCLQEQEKEVKDTQETTEGFRDHSASCDAFHLPEMPEMPLETTSQITLLYEGEKPELLIRIPVTSALKEHTLCVNFEDDVVKVGYQPVRCAEKHTIDVASESSVPKRRKTYKPCSSKYQGLFPNDG